MWPLASIIEQRFFSSIRFSSTCDLPATYLRPTFSSSRYSAFTFKTYHQTWCAWPAKTHQVTRSKSPQATLSITLVLVLNSHTSVFSQSSSRLLTCGCFKINTCVVAVTSTVYDGLTHLGIESDMLCPGDPFCMRRVFKCCQHQIAAQAFWRRRPKRHCFAAFQLERWQHIAHKVTYFPPYFGHWRQQTWKQNYQYFHQLLCLDLQLPKSHRYSRHWSLLFNVWYPLDRWAKGVVD